MMNMKKINAEYGMSNFEMAVQLALETLHHERREVGYDQFTCTPEDAARYHPWVDDGTDLYSMDLYSTVVLSEERTEFLERFPTLAEQEAEIARRIRSLPIGEGFYAGICPSPDSNYKEIEIEGTMLSNGMIYISRYYAEEEEQEKLRAAAGAIYDGAFEDIQNALRRNGLPHDYEFTHLVLDEAVRRIEQQAA